MTKIKLILAVAIPVLFASCGTNKTETKSITAEKIEKQVALADQQLSLLVADADAANRIPRTLHANGEMRWAYDDVADWTEGFYPGSLWYMYELTKDKKWKKRAEKAQELIEKHKVITYHHDLGFMFNCSFGNGYRLTNDEAYKEVIITAANSLITRFYPEVGCIKSWDVDRGWQATRGWKFPVIIDNMMNLELLFIVSELTGDPKYREIAISHADTTLKNHFREDGSSYHVIDYDPETGLARNKHTAQGFAHESSWARGQAWGIYGYTVCYKYTKDEKYLKHAEKIANYILSFEGTPEDGIPYWDYHAANIPNEPRDASAAAITASALIDLDKFTTKSYEADINKIMTSLSSDQYFAKVGENKHFLLMHSTGSVPHNSEIDVPLNYADYYYLEALTKLKK